MSRAVELDPFSVIINFNLGFCYYFARRYPEAVVQVRKAAELDPSFFRPHALLGLVHDASGQREQAITEYQRAYDLSRHSGGQADYAVLLADDLRAEGRASQSITATRRVKSPCATRRSSGFPGRGSLCSSR